MCCSSILFEIETRSRNFALVDLKHECRTSNVDAHLVARNAIARKFGCRVWFMKPPDFVPIYATNE
jgi:hypothetical protein